MYPGLQNLCFFVVMDAQYKKTLKTWADGLPKAEQNKIYIKKNNPKKSFRKGHEAFFLIVCLVKILLFLKVVSQFEQLKNIPI